LDTIANVISWVAIVIAPIIGDRGKDPCPDCTDGVVPDWSSHLGGAQSEVIVPGPHGAWELPQNVAEADRILRLNLKAGSASSTTLVSSSSVSSTVSGRR
jgi:hypothetical protein